MRRFELYRFRDASGISGTGVVAHGVEFPFDERGQAWVALKWLGRNPSIVFWPDIDSMLEVHGHLGASEVRWLDPDPFPDEEPNLAEAASSVALRAGPGHGDL